MLFRVVRINEHDETDPSVLIVSTHFHWRDQIGTLLQSLFQLTDAEQNVARLLIEGQDTNAIAQHRKTSEGTVRGQIKSIIAKMNLRSQKDIIRLIMTLGDFPRAFLQTKSPPLPRRRCPRTGWKAKSGNRSRTSPSLTVVRSTTTTWVHRRAIQCCSRIWDRAWFGGRDPWFEWRSITICV